MHWLKNIFEIYHTTHKTIISMEGVRGFAVFLVFLVHYMTLADPWILKNSISSKLALYVHSIGNMGVDLFFVLSGYLIYGMIIQKKRSFKDYILKRIWRIYPTFIVVFIMYLILSILFPSESKIPHDWVEGTTLIMQNLLLMPGLFDVTAIITVAWSLSYEFFYYLFIPLLITSMRMRSWKSRYRMALFLSISIAFFFYCEINGGPIQLLMFISGILLYDTIEGKFFKKIPPLGLPALFTAFASIIIFKELYPNGWLEYVLLYVLFYIFLLDCFLGKGMTTKLFSITAIRWLGNMSYSYYLLHALALKLVFMIMEIIYPSQQNETLLIWLLIIPVFMLTLMPTTLLFIYIEKPYSLTPKKSSI